MTRLIRAAGLRWPVEEDFEFGKDCFGLDQSQVRLYTAIARHAVLVMAAWPSAPSPPPCARPHRHPGTTPAGRISRPRRSRHDPADHPGDQAPVAAPPPAAPS